MDETRTSGASNASEITIMFMFTISATSYNNKFVAIDFQNQCL